MMFAHLFLFTNAKWRGEGEIQLSMVEELLHFDTLWKISSPIDFSSSDPICVIQEVQIRGVAEPMQNQFVLSNVGGSEAGGGHFNIELTNAALGVIEGKGIVKEQLIGWEFRNPELDFEGFEFYERQKDGSYLMRAEYASSDQYRTIIRGTLWQHTSDKKNKEVS